MSINKERVEVTLKEYLDKTLNKFKKPFGKQEGIFEIDTDIQRLVYIIELQNSALEKYADKNNWRYWSNNDVGAFDEWLDFKPDHYSGKQSQAGFTARQALAEIKKLLEDG